MVGCPQQWQVIIAIDMNCDSIKGQQMTVVAKNLQKEQTRVSYSYRNIDIVQVSFVVVVH